MSSLKRPLGHIFMTLEHAVKELEYALADNARMTVSGSHFYGVSRTALETILDIAKQRLMRIDPDPKLIRHETPRGVLSFDDIYAQLMVEAEAADIMRRKLYSAEILVDGLRQQIASCVNEMGEDKRRMDWLCSKKCDVRIWNKMGSIVPEKLRDAIDERMS